MADFEPESPASRLSRLEMALYEERWRRQKLEDEVAERDGQIKALLSIVSGLLKLAQVMQETGGR